MHIWTRIMTWRHGEFVGSDGYGNHYYQERKVPQGRRRKRWVVYAGAPEASAVPAEWHAWLTYLSDQPLQSGGTPEKPWIKPHVANLTGTPEAYLPQGHDLSGGHRAASSSDYEPWRP